MILRLRACTILSVVLAMFFRVLAEMHVVDQGRETYHEYLLLDWTTCVIHGLKVQSVIATLMLGVVHLPSGILSEGHTYLRLN